MMSYVALIVVLSNFVTESSGLWNQLLNDDCPLTCTCRLEHISETVFYRFLQKNKNEHISGEVEFVENNDVTYDENLETITELLQEYPSKVIRSAICIIQTETEPLELLNNLPLNIESLTVIQGYESGNKTIKLSYLYKFPQLLSLEVIGPHIMNKPVNSHLICEIDLPLPNIKYINFERILLKNGKKVENIVKETNEEDLTFEYIQKLEGDSQLHPLTIIQKGATEDDIVPYKIFKERAEADGDTPLFIGFKKLHFLRIIYCELNNVHWEMFDGLQELHYLMLERNNLRFIPAFAFYGTPNLKTLSLAHNRLLDIQITDLAGLLELEYLDLSFNNFTQLSELSLPPFPKLKLANFANNPISVIFPNTFEVMNTTDSLIIGSDDKPLSLITHSFMGLNLLQKLTLNNLQLNILTRDLLAGMPSLTELILSGNITKIEYDAFLEIGQIQTLILRNCQIIHMSMDAFIGLEKLQYLDLSNNKLEYLPPGIFDGLLSIRELYLNSNKLMQVPHGIFSKIHPKLLRLNENSWHCSCDMSDWKPMIINKVKQRTLKSCKYTSDKGLGCASENNVEYKYIFDNKVAPICAQPEKFINWSVFHAMKRILKCPNFKPKYRKHIHTKNATSLYINLEKMSTQVHTTEVSKVTNPTKLQLKNNWNTNTNVAINMESIADLQENDFNRLNLINRDHHFINSNLHQNRKKFGKIKRGHRRSSIKINEIN